MQQEYRCCERMRQPIDAPSPDSGMRTRGVTLVELLLVIVLVALLAVIALPRFAGWRDRQAARVGAARVATVLERGRSAAVRLGGPVEVEHRAGAFAITALLDTGAVVHLLGGLPPGVQVTGLDRAIRFGADGLGVGASNRTVVVQAGAQQRQVIVSRLGRVR